MRQTTHQISSISTQRSQQKGKCPMRIVKSSSIAKAAFAVSAIALSGAQAQAQTAMAAPEAAPSKPATVDNRVERLEALVQSLMERLEKQQGAALTVSEVKAIREDRMAIVHRAAPALDQKGNATAAALAARVEAMEKSATLGFRVGASTIKLGGFFKTDVSATRYSGGDPAPGAAIRYYNSTPAIPVGGIGEGVQTVFNGRETRFIISSETPIGNQKLSGQIELDFLDTPLIGNERVVDGYVPRIRQAFFTYGNWTFGQAWSTFQNVTALPERIDFIGPVEGTVFSRQPMVRYTKGGLQMALEQPETTIQTNATTSIEADDDRMPDVIVRYNMKGKWGAASVAAIGRYLNYRADVANGTDAGAFGWGVSASGVIKVGKRDNFNFMMSGGKGIGRYLAQNLRDDAVVVNAHQFETIGVISGFGSFRHFWTDKWRSVLTGGYYQAYNPAQAGQLVTNNSYSGNFDTLYSPAKPLTIGVGYRHSRRELENGRFGDVDRVQFSTQYNF